MSELPDELVGVLVGPGPAEAADELVLGRDPERLGVGERPVEVPEQGGRPGAGTGGGVGVMAHPSFPGAGMRPIRRAAAARTAPAGGRRGRPWAAGDTGVVPLPAEVDAVVVGAGPNGLVGANRLADAGWDVLLLEAQPDVGGAVRSDREVDPEFVSDTFSAFYPMAAVSPAHHLARAGALRPGVVARTGRARPPAPRRFLGAAAPRRGRDRRPPRAGAPRRRRRLARAGGALARPCSPG